jgi:hypothetical protein
VVGAAATVADPALRLAHGQCVEHTARAKPICPSWRRWVDCCARGAASRCCQRADLARADAPALRPEDRELFRQELQGTTRERMLREFAEVVDTLTVDTPLLLVLEDLHWAIMPSDVLLWWPDGPRHACCPGNLSAGGHCGHSHPLRTVTHEPGGTGTAPNPRNPSECRGGGGIQPRVPV